MLSARGRLLGVTTLLLVLGAGAAASVRPGTHSGAMWPVGLASGLLLLRAAGTRPMRAALVLAVTALTFAVTGYPLAVSLGYAASVTALALFTQALLPGGGTSRADGLDLAGYLVAAVGGAVVGAAGFTLTSALTGYGVAAYVGVSALIAQVASQLVLVPFFLEDNDLPGSTDHRERAVRWALTIAVTALAFVPVVAPLMVFLVLPMLAWTAMRASLREVLWQLVLVGTITNIATYYELGPFARHDDGMVAELVPLPHYAFLVGCALVSIPFTMTARRRRASELAGVQRDERYQRLLDASTGVCIIECDAIGRITSVNAGAQKLLGYRREELVGRFPDRLHSDAEIARQAERFGCPAELMHVSLAMAEPSVGARDWRFLRKDGEERTFSMRLERLTDEHGEVTGYLSTAEDVTEGVRTREALVAALETERRAVARLTEVDRTKDAFVSSVSHELRTPITNIVGYLELLLDGAYGETSAAQHEALGRIDLNSHRLLELIDDLLTLSSIESLDVELTREPVDLRSVIERAAEKVRPTSIARGQRLDVELPSWPVVVHGDGTHLERMVGNLAGNAVKFTPEGGSVALRVVADEGAVALEVHDTGIGIPDEEQGQLFNRFFRSSTAQRAAVQGSGLGLSIARSIAELHGARISATSRLGEGSVFRVNFPEQRAD